MELRINQQRSYAAQPSAEDDHPPKDPDGWFNHAIACYTTGAYAGAVAAFTTYLVWVPNDAEGHYWRGLAYQRNGQHWQAVLAFDHCLRLDPEYYAAYHQRGLAYASDGQLERAISNFSKSLALQPDHAASYLERGTAYLHLGQQAQGRVDLAWAAGSEDGAVAAAAQQRLAALAQMEC